jgi:hypothetical protein
MFIQTCKRLEIAEEQYHAVFPDILEDRAETYFMHYIGPDKRFDEMYNLLDSHFNTSVNHSQYWADWTSMTYDKVRAEFPEKSPHDALDHLLERLQIVQRALGEGFQGEITLRTAAARACTGVPELAPAFLSAKPTCEGFFADLHAALKIAADTTPRTYYTEQELADIGFVDRRYVSNSRQQSRGRGGWRGGFVRRGSSSGLRGSDNRSRSRLAHSYRAKKKCFVCGKEGCWSSNHTQQERDRVRNAYNVACESHGQEPPGDDDFDLFLQECEGSLPYEEEEERVEGDMEEAVAYLTEQAFLHRATGEDIYCAKKTEEADTFVLSSNYAVDFQGELWDTGAARVSTVGKDQALAFVRQFPGTTIDWTPGSTEIRFGGDVSKSAIGTIDIKNPLGTVRYHILDAPTPFLFSLHDADRLGAFFNNVQNVIVRKDGTTIPVVRKWGHPFFNARETNVFFTESELRQLHRRFGHPRTERLYKLLTEAGHSDVDISVLENLQKFCHLCQTHGQAPRRFKFAITDECDFNYEVIIDVVHLKGRNALHVIDSATSFQAATFLKSMSARDAWNALCKCWIYVYQGPPDIIVHDPGTNFSSEEFRQHARIVGVSCKEMPVEAHWAVGKIERAHGPLRRAYEMLHDELSHCTDSDTILQMAVKALNDTAGPNGIVPTLLVFGTYPRINQDSPPSPDIQTRAIAVQKAMKMLRQIQAERDVNHAKNSRNGPVQHANFPLQSEVLVWREKGGWKGPYKVQSVQERNVTVDINGPTTFRATQVKPYFREEVPSTPPYEKADVQPRPPQPIRRMVHVEIPVKPRTDVFLTEKEQKDFVLAVELRQKGVITTPGNPFEESDRTEINDLLTQGVFRIVKYNAAKHRDVKIFGTRLVREVKGKTTRPYEKSRLVVQGFADNDKKTILTQAPTIQRMSQRLIFALGPSLIASYGMWGELRDITQAYVQSDDKLARYILARLPKEIQGDYPRDTLLEVIRPLYGIAEAGAYWFRTYQEHHIKELKMKPSTFDPCLLFRTGGPETFGITGLQTDDTFSFVTKDLSRTEEEKIARFRAKEKTVLEEKKPLEFNGGRIELCEGDIRFSQKGQVNQLRTIDPAAEDAAQQYVAQRARGAYISSICQPEAAFDLSTAAQVREPEKDDFAALNARIQWQIDNPARGLRFIPLDLSCAKLYIFTDGSFANNKDLTSQLGFVIALANEVSRTHSEFEIQGNVVHWNSSKCKRVTRSVLASELYGMMNGFDAGIALGTTLQQITASLNLPQIPIIVCADSRSLYECIVKLGTTVEKRLMIDIMSLRESYERREIAEIRWIVGKDNPADACTKKNPNTVLERLVSRNRITIRVEAFVQRPEKAT